MGISLVFVEEVVVVPVKRRHWSGLWAQRTPAVLGMQRDCCHLQWLFCRIHRPSCCAPARMIARWVASQRRTGRPSGADSAQSLPGIELLRLNQISCQNPEVSMLGAVEFDFPIGRPNDRLVGNSIRVATIRALLAANRTRLVRASVDVNHVRHFPDYTADAGDRVLCLPEKLNGHRRKIEALEGAERYVSGRHRKTNRPASLLYFRG